MNRVLVTGASGFIGRHCLSLLTARGFEVHAISRQATQSTDPPINWHPLDLFETDRCRRLIADLKPTHLLHLAWFTTPGVFWSSSENFKWVASTLELLQAFAASGGEKIVAAGSCAEYAWGREYNEVTSPLQPATIYGVCKSAARQMLTAYSDQVGLNYAWGRVFFMFGPDEPSGKLVSSVITSLLKEEVALCTAGFQIRDFLYVKDVADAFVTMLDSDFLGIANIGSGECTSVKELAVKIANKLQRPELLRLGGRSSHDEPEFIVATTSRLRDEMNWKPKTDLDQSLDETIEWYKRALNRRTS